MNMKQLKEMMEPDLSDVTPYEIQCLRKFNARQLTEKSREFKFLVHSGFLVLLEGRYVTTLKSKRIIDEYASTKS